MPTFDPHNNLVYGLVKTAPSPASSGLTLILDKTDYGDSFPDPATYGAYNCTVWPLNTAPRKTNATIIRITAKSDNAVLDETTLTFTRSQESSNNRSILDGDQIAMTVTAKSIKDIETELSLIPYAGNLYVTVGFSGADYICDGVADNVQIQQALDAVNALGGGTVHIKRGTYDIAVLLLIYSNTTLEGDGWSTILRSANNVNIGVIKGQAIVKVLIRNLAIDMNKDNNTTINDKQGLFFNTATDSTVENVYLHDMRRVAGQGNSMVAYTNCTNCIFRNNYIDTTGDYAFVSNGMQGCKVINNYIKNPSSHGIAVAHGGYGTSFQRPSKNVISGNIVYYDTDAAFAGDGIKIINCDYSEITNNILYSDTVNGYVGILFVDSEEAACSAANMQYSTHLNISGNLIYGARWGIYGQGLIDCNISDNNIFYRNKVYPVGITLGKGSGNAVDVPSTRNIVANNYIEEDTNTIYTGIGLYLITGATYNILIGNTVINASNAGVSLGTTGDYCDYNRIIGNNIINSAHNGMQINGKYCTITNNLVRGSSRYANDTDIDIYLLQVSTYNTVQGNSFIADGTNKARYGYYGGVNADYNTITGNIFVGQVNATKVYSLGVNNKINNNTGYVTENKGTGTIASGATSAVITHGLSFTPTLQNIFITLGELSTADPGQIYVTNITSTQFTVNCRTNPGVSGLDFAWMAQK